MAQSSSLCVPGQMITSETGFLRGHGSYIIEGPEFSELVASVAGQVERVDKLISVKPVKSRYVGAVGDLVVGRIRAVESNRWKVDISSVKDANLQLSSVNLPGGAQRIRTHEDQLNMRSLYTEHDLISAEIQIAKEDGTTVLHTRSLKYGKLENGQLIIVPSSLIKRVAHHNVSLPWGIDVLLGLNGYIWISRSIPSEWRQQQEDDMDTGAPEAETLQRLRDRHATTPLLKDERLRVARVRNAVNALSMSFRVISPESIASVYEASVSLGHEPMDMLKPDVIREITMHLDSQ